MTEWQGAVLLAQLERFPEQHAVRNANAIALGEALAQVPGLRAQKRDERMDSQGNYCFVVHYDSSEFAGMPLRRFEEALYAEGVPLGVSYPVALRPRRVPQRAASRPRGEPRLRRSTTRTCTCRWPSTPRPRRSGWSTASCWPIATACCGSREAAARIHEHAAAIMEKLPIGAGA